jgi:RNA polymerase-binding transcription factor DksA
MLMQRKRTVQDEVYGHLRDARAHCVSEVRDDAEVANGHIQDDIWVAVLQMRAASASGIDAALRRLDAGHFGYCAECGKEISERRLGAMPFAARCQPCEQRREEQRNGQSGRRESLSLFPDLIGP